MPGEAFFVGRRRKEKQCQRALVHIVRKAFQLGIGWRAFAALPRFYRFRCNGLAFELSDDIFLKTGDSRAQRKTDRLMAHPGSCQLCHTAHLHDRHRVIAEDVHHLDRDLAPPRRAFVKDALQFQRPVLLRAEALPLVLEDVIARPDLFPSRLLTFLPVGFFTRMISRLLSKSKSTAQ